MKKTLTVLLALVLVVVMSVAGTMAYLTDDDAVTNTFTVGNVQIKLDEAPVDTNGKKTDGDRVQANEYKLLPGLEYDKDPMVTVLEGSERSYIKMTVTFTESAALDAIFAPNGADMTSIFKGYDGTVWEYKNVTEDTVADTRTYEFWYKDPVDALKANVALEPLFTSITVPDFIDNDQLKTINGMEIIVNAYAIQADGFTDAADAWKHYK